VKWRESQTASRMPSFGCSWAKKHDIIDIEDINFNRKIVGGARNSIAKAEKMVKEDLK